MKTETKALAVVYYSVFKTVKMQAKFGSENQAVVVYELEIAGFSKIASSVSFKISRRKI